MAKVKTQKSRKEYKCSKCGATINIGDTYHKIVEQFRQPRVRCAKCKPERSELTNSEYYSWLYDLQDHFEERYDLRSEDGKDEIYSELENMRDELQSRLDNMPEQLQYAPTGEMLQERIDCIDNAISELDNLDFPDKEDFNDENNTEEENEQEYQDALDEFETNIIDAICNLE